ncbi:ABC transporter substrate-binding protein [Natronobiforma cellulositropha]|uniref:ABC transporter substrate-binding protein n=1 Tax=Natronobiforma cellulositropha TaxID=1679076 RepID=UPI0021D57151|nr:ABC transporter substrate-binding protein [Natronobiforma cellulositropha]
MVDSQSHEKYDDVVSRRKFVALTGVAGAAALAGCSGNGDDDEGGNGNGNGGNGNGGNGDAPDDRQVEPDEKVADSHGDVDIWFETGNWDDPTNVQFNPFNPAAQGGQMENAVWEEFANYNLELGEWIPHAVTEWEITDEEITLEFRDDLVWSDGEDVTAEDVAVGMRLGRYQDAELWDFASDVEADGDSTVVITLEEPVNEEVAEWIVLTENVNSPAHVYGEYLERIEEDGEDEDDVMGELVGWDDREPVTCGPFYFSDDESTNEYMAAPAFDDHPDADYINFNGYHMYQRSSNEAYQQSMLGDEFDGLLSLFVPSSVVQRFPDTVDEVRFPGTFGVGLIFNHDVEPFDDRNVRQAISFASDMELAANNADPESKAVPAVPAGITSATVEDYLGDDIDMYESYAQDGARASDLLEDSGYTLTDAGDQWLTPDGDEFSFEIKYPAGWSDWVSAIETVASQLNNFGINVELNGVERGTLESDLGDSDFEVAGFEWNEGALQFNHPYYSIRHQLRNRQLDSEASFFNYPEEATVPAMDGSGEITVNFEERLADLASANDPDEASEIIKELAWVINQDLPMLPIQDKYEQSFLNNERWDYPDPSRGGDEWHYLQVQWPLFWLPKRGLLAARE